MTLHGYAGTIAHVDLSEETVTEIDTADYLPEYIGGFGIAVRLVWEQTTGETGPFDPENPFIVATGPLAGTPSPTSGRAEITGVAPQGYPEPWVVHSGFGGNMGFTMKSQGYDLLMVTGAADSPTYLAITDDGFEFRDASDLWGLDTKPAQIELDDEHPENSAIAVIGPAGENLVRWSIVLSESENAAGQGGFGAVMGSKQLKAIVMEPGTHELSIADPDKVLRETRRIADEIPTGSTAGTLDCTEPLESERTHGSIRLQSGTTSCGECTMSFQQFNANVPRHFTGHGTVDGVQHCVGVSGPNLLNGKWDGKWADVSVEFNELLNQLGLNNWEAFAGMNWFLQNAYNSGELSELMGHDLDLNPDGPAVYPKEDAAAGFDPEFAVEFLKNIAYRRGKDGDILAEGSPRAAEEYGLEDVAKLTHKHGYGPHWDGRYLHFIPAPLWAVNGLIWAGRGRDPFSNTHGFGQNWMNAVTEWGEGPVPYEKLEYLSEQIYGTKYALAGWKDPSNLYRDKEIPAIWHDHRSILKSSAPVCDQIFPLTYTTETDDMLGDYTAEIRMFNAVVGTDYDLEEMYEHTERVFNQLRAIHVRQGRERSQDERIVDYYQQPDMRPDDAPPQVADPDAYRALMDRYYMKRGWDIETGWPTRSTLESFGLSDVADELESLGRLP